MKVHGFKHILIYHIIGGDIFFYQLGMSMSLFIAVVITTILVILMLSMYIYHKRGTLCTNTIIIENNNIIINRLFLSMHPMLFLPSRF